MKQKFLISCATLGPIGFSPLMPGTVASALTCFFYWAFSRIFAELGWAWCAHMLFVFMSILIFIVGWRASAEYVAFSNKKDPSEVVIDEVCGMLTALLGVWYVSNYGGWAYVACMNEYLTVGHYGVAFLLFRFFDITKMFPVNWCERHPWIGFAIMLDDIAAGCMTVGVFMLYGYMRG